MARPSRSGATRPGASWSALALGLALGLAAGATADSPPPLDVLVAQLRARETAFAKTMADRDHAAFGAFVSEEALFMGRTVLRGRAAVLAGWKPYFEGAQAPFSWTPERVEVIASGTLAISSGPVFDPKGQRASTFNSTWRRDKDGVWRVVIDIGCPPCPDCASASAAPPAKPRPASP